MVMHVAEQRRYHLASDVQMEIVADSDSDPDFDVHMGMHVVVDVVVGQEYFESGLASGVDHSHRMLSFQYQH